MTKVILDTSFICDWKNPDKTQEEKRKFDFFEQNLEKKKVRICIPTPTLSELLMGPIQQCVPGLSKNVQFLPFNEKAAIECADIFKNKQHILATKAKVKFDCQIIAIALANEIKTIYSDDKQIKQRGKQLGLTVITKDDLELPPATLFDKIS